MLFGQSRHTLAHHVVLISAFTGCTALVIYISTAATTYTDRFGGVDGGELTAAALNGGVAHPSGYPTYLLLARAALQLSSGEPAAVLARLSAVCTAFAVGGTASLLYLLLCRTQFPPSAALIGSLYGAFVATLSPRIWSQAVIVEVYALHLLLLIVCSLLVFLWLVTHHDRALLGFALILGLGLGNHLTLAMVGPAAAIAWLVSNQRPALTSRRVALMLGGLTLGLAVYACLPFWSGREALPSWGDQRTLAGFWTHVTGAEYRYLIGVVPLSQRLSRVSYAARDLLAQPGWLGLIIAVWLGIPWLWRTCRPMLALTGSIALGNLLFASTYGGADGTVYLIGWTWAWCIWAGVGAAMLWQNLRYPLRLGFGTILLVTLIWSLRDRYPQFNLRNDTAARDQALAQLALLPTDAVLLTSDDRDTFASWYVQSVLELRPDVLVLDTRLWQHQWYRAQIARVLAQPSLDTLCPALTGSRRPVYAATTLGAPQAVPDTTLHGQLCPTD